MAMYQRRNVYIGPRSQTTQTRDIRQASVNGVLMPQAAGEWRGPKTPGDAKSSPQKANVVIDTGRSQRHTLSSSMTASLQSKSPIEMAALMATFPKVGILSGRPWPRLGLQFAIHVLHTLGQPKSRRLVVKWVQGKKRDIFPNQGGRHLTPMQRAF